MADIASKKAALKDTPAGGVVDNLIAKSCSVIDALFPPAQREKAWIKFKDFATSYPKLTVRSSRTSP
jgi:hypothetical protein